jgi:hypothetical protein
LTKELDRKNSISEAVQNWWDRMTSPAVYFFRRLTIASTVIPTMIPTMMDSHGKPGTAGRTIGVETETVVELLVVVGVLTTVIVETETDVLTTVSGLVVVTGVVEALNDVELVTEAGVVVVATELEFELVLVTC